MRSGDFEIKRAGKGIAEAAKYAGQDTVVTVPEKIDMEERLICFRFRQKAKELRWSAL